MAALDKRTRHWHRELDGVIQDVDKPFENDFGKIMYPGDPTADGANIYNCRCTLIAAIKGFERDASNMDDRYNDKLGDMSYDEWKKEKKSTSDSLNKQDKIARKRHQRIINYMEKFEKYLAKEKCQTVNAEVLSTY